jgi:hypothetical protein
LLTGGFSYATVYRTRVVSAGFFKC